MADITRMQWGASDWQYADLYMPDEPSEFDKGHGVPCVMLIHGGFWKEKFTLELMKPIAEDLAEAGIASWNIEFKRWNPVEKGIWVDTVSDVMRAWGQLALLPGIDMTRSMVMGHSAGGHLALLLASKAETKPWLTIAQSPVCDLFSADSERLSDEGDAVRNWIGSDPIQDSKTWTSINPLDNPPKTPVLLAHGKEDADVPISQSETYYRVMNAKKCDIQKLWLNGDHYSIIDVASDDWLVILNAIQDWL